MKKYILSSDINVFGFQVKSFPQGISEAFDNLMNTIDDKNFTRSYYGITKAAKDGSMLYYATALENSSDEADKYNLERLSISKGEYLTETLNDWLTKIDSIKTIFQRMMQDGRVDKTKPCVEWYKNKNEMMCMVSADISK
ncbi:MAG: hypothetical protein ABIO81_14050 [Ginsengibacter sp.]